MKSFDFKGPIASSKSYFNRALILSHYHPSLKILGSSESQDVVHLQRAVSDLRPEMSVGEGGTTLRFLSFLVSRKPGIWKLTGSERLFLRPQQELKNIFDQLGVQLKFGKDFIEIHSSGWAKCKHVNVDLSQSSQFASGLILNAWDLPFDLTLHLSQSKVSDGYLQMTLDLVQEAGMSFIRDDHQIKILAHQKITSPSIRVEPDVSSAFVVASLAASRGHCEIHDFPFQSLQPDTCFVDLFKRMQIPFQKQGTTLVVDRCVDLKPLEVSLRQAPDLFPVLCVLLAQSKGDSRIFDTPQLVHKESNRLKKTGELLGLMKIDHEMQSHGILIKRDSSEWRHHHHNFFEFDPDHDHRLAFAAAVAKSIGYRIRIKNSNVVNKSFPGFWNLIGGGPG